MFPPRLTVFLRRSVLVFTGATVVFSGSGPAVAMELESDLSTHGAPVGIRPISEDDSAKNSGSSPLTLAEPIIPNSVAAQAAHSATLLSMAGEPSAPGDSGGSPATTTDTAPPGPPVSAPASPLPAAAVAAAPAPTSSTSVASANTSASVPGAQPPVSAPVAATDDEMNTPGSVSAAASTTEVAANNPAPEVQSSALGLQPASAPSQNVTINLINLMVTRRLISRSDADGLIRQAQQEADVARSQAAVTQATAERALTAEQTPPAPAPAAAPPAGGDDEVRVTYVPDVVKKEITEQVTQNVMEQTRQEHLADTIAANEVPEWVRRFHVAGDFRVRYENDQFPNGNAVGDFVNFNAINTNGTGLNQNTLTPTLPQYDADRDRNRFRLRARIGAGIDLGDNFTVGMRVGTGSDNSPVTENQTLGLANNGQGGDFSKYGIWLDRAFLRYEWGGTDDRDASLAVGRFDNPFFNTSMMWANDLAFDGIVAHGSYKVAKGVTPFLTGGAFPIFNTDLNFSTYQAAKFQSEDKYLFAVQGGSHFNVSKDINLIGAAGFYDFENVQGKVSDPILNAGLSAGDTDDSRPSFAQNGNTYIALRNYQDPTSVPGVTVENQYYGLASPFRVVSLTGQVDYEHFDPFHLSLTGEFIKNVAFDRNSILNGGPASNPGPQNNTSTGTAGSFDGGGNGYMVHFDLGKVVLQNLWDWNVRLSYRYVETDATVDGFTDADFGGPLTGTNLKGYTIGGNLAFSQRVYLGLRYESADNVSGPTYRNDLIQFDINAQF